MTEYSKIKISTPGRVCLFGEHQDYLQLPIIASAISKHVYVEGTKRYDNNVNISMPDISEEVSFKIGSELSYTKERDYLRSSLNIVLREGYTFSSGFDCLIHGDIPINAGASSSSALIVSWINFLLHMSDQSVSLPVEEIAYLAYKAEVLEFAEPGGMMDHYSTAVGGVIGLSSYPNIQLSKINTELGALVLGNSGEPKDTKFILARVKKGVIKIVDELKKQFPQFSLQDIKIDELGSFKNSLSDEQYELLYGTVRNRDITREALTLLGKKPLDHKLLGNLLNEHQAVLRDVLKISTPKIDSMIKAALDAGAYGAKINGSGGGGTMFAYAPENPKKVLEAIDQIATETYIVYSDKGTQAEVFEEVEK